MGQRRVLGAPVLLLDYDGVLHPDKAYRTKNGLVLHAPGHSFFEWAGLLEAPLAAAPNTVVALSTSWVHGLGFAKAKAFLPAWLQARVRGATWHQRIAAEEGWFRWWAETARFDQIAHYVDRRSIRHWIALDDVKEWPAFALHRLVRTNASAGLAGVGAVEALTKALIQNEKAWLESQAQVRSA